LILVFCAFPFMLQKTSIRPIIKAFRTVRIIISKKILEGKSVYKSSVNPFYFDKTLIFFYQSFLS